MTTAEKAKEKGQELASAGGGKDGSVAKKILVPLAASAASAVTAYAARKVPALVRDKLLPKLNSGGATAGAGGAISKTKDAIGGTVTNAVSSVSDRIGGGGEDGQREGKQSSDGRGKGKRAEERGTRGGRQISNEQREQERRERAERRRERRETARG